MVKRPRPSGPKTHLPADFKRRKAKVGKRATKPANVTDTSFRSASVRVGDQTVDLTARAEGEVDGAPPESLELISARGKSLDILLSSLGHHASNVRASALRGIQDAVAHSHPAAVRANLPQLLPALGRAWSDEEGECRHLALGLTRECCRSSRDGRVDLAAAARPFLSLLAAFAASALNALDDDVRRDGAGAVEVLCAAFGGALADAAAAPIGGTGGEAARGGGGAAAALLPAYVRLLADEARAAARAQAKAEASGDKKASKKKGKEKQGGSTVPAQAETSGGGGGPVLRSLVALLRAAAVGEATAASSEAGNAFSQILSLLQGPDVVYRPGGTACNALLLPRPLSSGSRRRATATENFRATTAPSARVLVYLLDGLRDRIVEVSQRGRLTGSAGGGGGGESCGSVVVAAAAGGLSISVARLDALHLLLTASRLLWTDRCVPRLASSDEHSLGPAADGDGKTELARLPKSGVSLLRLLLEIFPLSDDAGDDGRNSGRFESTNAGMCGGLIELGSSLQRKYRGGGNKNDAAAAAWVDAVFEYVLPRLEPKSVSSESDGGREEDGTSSLSSSAMLLSAVARLLLRSPSGGDGDRYLLRDGARRAELLGAFGDAFFPRNVHSEGEQRKEKPPLSAGARRSAAGRKAALLLAALLGQHCPTGYGRGACSSRSPEDRARNPSESDSEGDESDGMLPAPPSGHDESSTWNRIAAMARILPSYLQAWDADFPSETAAVLASLLGVARTHDVGQAVEVDGEMIEVFDDVAIDGDGGSEVRGSDKSGDTRRDDARGELVLSLRLSLTGLFAAPRKKKSKKRRKERTDTPPPRRESVFERLPPRAQRLALALVGMLRFPPAATLDGLGIACSRAGGAAEEEAAGAVSPSFCLSDDVASYATDVAHDLRRTVTMQSYLTFLVRCTGVASSAAAARRASCAGKAGGGDNEGGGANPDPPGSDIVVFARDAAVARACRSLLRCGAPPATLLSSLSPVLMSWLERRGEDIGGGGAGADEVGYAVSSRAALAIMACLARSSASDEGDSLGADSLSTYLVPDLGASGSEGALVEAVCDQLVLAHSLRRSSTSVPGAVGDEGGATARAWQARFLSPVATLLGCQPILLDRVVALATTRVMSTSNVGKSEDFPVNARNGLDCNSTESTIRSLLYLLRSGSLAESVLTQDVSRALRKAAVEIENFLAEGPLDRISGELRTEVRMRIGEDRKVLPSA